MSKYSVKQILELMKVIQCMSLEEFHLAYGDPGYRGSIPSGFVVQSYNSMRSNALEYFNSVCPEMLDILFDAAEKKQLIYKLKKETAKM